MSNSEQVPKQPELDVFAEPSLPPIPEIPPIKSAAPFIDISEEQTPQTDIKFGAHGWKLEEARRLEESAGLNESIIQVPTGYLVRVDQGPGDYLIMVTSLGKQIAIHRTTALLRAKAALDMCLAETGGADPALIDRDIEMIYMMFKAVITNARANGKLYNSQSIKKFEQMLLKAQKAWKGRSENTTALDNVRQAYGK